eukprot:4659359-Amphidinium_carterae.2
MGAGPSVGWDAVICDASKHGVVSLKLKQRALESRLCSSEFQQEAAVPDKPVHDHTGESCPCTFRVSLCDPSTWLKPAERVSAIPCLKNENWAQYSASALYSTSLKASVYGSQINADPPESQHPKG